MKNEFDFFAPLDPQLLDSYSKNSYAAYNSSADVWALGITALSYIFNEEFNSYYDWTKKVVRKDKIDKSIATLYESQFDSNLSQLIVDMLNMNAAQRIRIEQIADKLVNRY